MSDMVLPFVCQTSMNTLTCNYNNFVKKFKKYVQLVQVTELVYVQDLNPKFLISRASKFPQHSGDFITSKDNVTCFESDENFDVLLD